MRYRDLIQFEPIETVIQLREAARMGSPPRTSPNPSLPRRGTPGGLPPPPAHLRGHVAGHAGGVEVLPDTLHWVEAQADLRQPPRVIVCPLELADLYRDRLESFSLTATIERT